MHYQKMDARYLHRKREKKIIKFIFIIIIIIIYKKRKKKKKLKCGQRISFNLICEHEVC